MEIWTALGGSGTAPPLVLVDGWEGGLGEVSAAARAHGWEIRDGFAEARSGRVLHAGVVRTGREAAGAVLAAVRGAAVAADCRAPRAVIDRLHDDLARVGSVVHLNGPPPLPVPRLSDDERAILGLLGEGLSLGEAARRLHVSRRTADRRLASARRCLGVASTSEALRAVEAPADS